MEPTTDVAPTPIDHAIGTLLSICDNLLAALQSPDLIESYITEARNLMTKIDYVGWQRVGKVYTYTGSVHAPDS